MLPPLGRFIPGHLVVALAGAFAWTAGAPLLAWLATGALLGTFAGDLTNHARAKRHARALFGGRGGMGLPGSDLDRLERAVRRAPVATVLVRRFFTRDRALLPFAAAGWEAAPRAYVPLTLAAGAVWTALWLAAGYGLASLTRALPPALGVAATMVVLMALAWPLAQKAGDADAAFA